MYVDAACLAKADVDSGSDQSVKLQCSLAKKIK